MIERYRVFLDEKSQRTDHQFHMELVYLTQLNEHSFSKIVDSRFIIQPYVCAAIALHPQLKHSLRELAQLYFNGDVRPKGGINGARLVKLLDVINNLHHKRPYMYTKSP